ncbi:MAG: site-2 protease family protein [Candidatus Babeliales bacterium]|jgi:Zn-dependent protease
MYSSWFSFFAKVAIILPAFLIAVSFHEFSHALVAHWLGDDTAKNRGRLTLNPLAHVDLLGLFFLLIFRIGWASPVPMDYRNFKHPRIYSIIAALAGPFSNFLLAYVCFLTIAHFPGQLFAPAFVVSITQVLSATADVNVMLGAFNILPIPPLDGSHIVNALLIEKFPRAVAWLHRYSLIILLVLFITPQFQTMLSDFFTYTEQILKSLVF